MTRNVCSFKFESRVIPSYTWYYSKYNKVTIMFMSQVNWKVKYYKHCHHFRNILLYFTLYTGQCTLYNIHYALYDIQCKLYTLHYTKFIIQCVQRIPHMDSIPASHTNSSYLHCTVYNELYTSSLYSVYNVYLICIQA